MPELMTQQELEDQCPKMTEDMHKMLDSAFADKTKEAIIYALAQAIHERIEAFEAESEEKGAIVSTIISGLMEFNQEDLAAYNELRRSLIEQKSSTVH